LFNDPWSMRVACMRGAFVVGPLLAASIAVASAARLDVPPVVISSLDHTAYFQGPQYQVADGVRFPGAFNPSTGYSSSGFSANLAAYDQVRVRFQAAPGMKFLIHSFASAFNFEAYWPKASFANNTGLSAPGTVTFENPAGAMPTPYPESYDKVTDQGEAIVVGHSYHVTGEFEFTAVQIDFPIGHAVPSILRSYDSVHTNWDPSFSASGVSGSLDAHPMELVPTAPVANVSSSWGRVKALYR
jgi:hypothetical protein